MILNYFLMNSIVWSLTLFLYSLNYSALYLSFSKSTSIFFVIQILLSLLLGYIFFLANKKYKTMIISKEKFKIRIFLITIGFLTEFFYMQTIPLIKILIKKDNSYIKIEGIPTFHTFLMTYTSYIAIRIFYNYLNTSNKNELKLFGYINFLMILMGSRFLMLGIFIPCLLLYFDSKKKSFKNIILLFFITIFSLGLFGIFGNIRHSQKINDYTYIKAVGSSNKKFAKSLVPDMYFWSYLYITSPLANLEKNIQENKINKKINTFYHSIIPDFLQERFLREEKTKKLQINSALNVSTSYLIPYLSFGFLGMSYFFIILNIYFILILFFSKNENRKILSSIIVTITLLNVFSNMFTFSALSFQMVYPILNQIIKKIKINEKVYLNGKNNSDSFNL
ncbi:MAG: O-antigen polymerase [Fusobacteriaceae bacterium]